MYGGLSREELGRRIVADIQPCDLSLVERFPRKWMGLDAYIRKDNNECIALALSGADCWSAMSGKTKDAAMPFLQGNMSDYYYDKNTGKLLGKIELAVPDEYMSDGPNHEDLEIAFWWFLGGPDDIPAGEQEAKPEPKPELMSEPVKIIQLVPSSATAAVSYASSTCDEPFIRLYHRYF